MKDPGSGHWSVFVAGVVDGTRYGFLVAGPGGSGLKRDPRARELERRTDAGWDALRTAPTRTLAVQTAAAALEQNLIGEAATSAKMTAAKLLACVEQLSDADRRLILREAEIGDETVRLRGLGARSRLASALRSAL